ncbi:SAM-dependent methyltransferase [Paenibacillus sp. JX-17]|uniref:SAM-dependent methyltransferase n=1 Tax=Paenibacillus lacisoli TaxID=3064525 RepID=A0ABT9CDD4_9BACL|nr:SAM-dependent methyltransferase [Paenibacillus sp. JX-17]MDO7907252.1 SAM-dependent methyltransferase [Paenibacillus sp. JX-17]
MSADKMRLDQAGTRLELARVIFIGRTFEEYMRMFDLSTEELEGKSVLDCPAGACSFTAKGSAKGLDITACDIAYDHDIDTLEDKGRLDVEHATTNMADASANFRWEYFRSIPDLQAARLQALEDCVQDMASRPERYIPAALPVLPFKDRQFDLVLSAHFLFMYADRLDKIFHKAAVDELLRVAREELRIFPLVNLAGERYAGLDPLIADLKSRGYEVLEQTVSYEFQYQANSMLRIRCRK